MARGEIKIRQLKIDNLIAVYEQTYKDIIKTITNATTAGKIRQFKVMATIRAQLTDLGVNVNEWVKKEIPQYYLDGANVAMQDLKSLGVDLSGPKGLIAINKEAISTLVNDTNLSFANGMTSIARNAQVVVTDAVKQQINLTIAQGALTGSGLKAVATDIKQTLKDNGLAALTDAGGKKWSFDTYANMLARTKAVEARNQGLMDKMQQQGYDLVQVSDHGTSCPLCGPWEGQILSISGDSSEYDSTDDAEADGLMHPNCEHAYDVIEPDLADQTQAYDNSYNDNADSEDDSSD